jgi:uncharacterized protein (TIGR00730 family)
MDLRDCQLLAQLYARTWPDPSDPLRALGRLMGESSELEAAMRGSGGRTISAQARDGRLARELTELLLQLADLANRCGLDLAAQMEARRRAFFLQHPALAEEERPPAVPQRIERVTVYAASSRQARPSFLEAAEELGRLLAAEGWIAVYGGGSIGLMGALSQGVRRHGGTIEGVILDRFIERGVSDAEVPDMKTVSTMRSRKRGLEEDADAFVCLPGGLGTLEELFETLSFRHLGFHYKPIVMCNLEGFWDETLRQLERCFAERLIPESSRGTYQVVSTPAEAVELLRAWKPPAEAAPSQASELQPGAG